MASAPVGFRRLTAGRVSHGTSSRSIIVSGTALLWVGLLSMGAFLGIGAQAATAATRGPLLQSGTIAAPIPKFAIRIVPGSVIHLVAKSSKLPISIRNDYNAEIRVQVHVAPSNLNALVPASIEVTVPAQTTFTAQVPVSAIADGDVPLRAWLTTFSGLPLGDAVNLDLTVNAEIEDSVIAGFLVIVAGLGVAGVLRTRAKRLRLKQSQNS